MRDRLASAAVTTKLSEFAKALFAAQKTIWEIGLSPN
jgi:hypothetical protein